MDEKGFLLGVTKRTKRVFSKQLWEQKKVTAALQDGNREWITILACVCADGSSIDPAVIFEGRSGLHDSWVRDLEVGKHQIFCATSESGWSNNQLALAWVEQLFDRLTKVKAKRDFRLLLLDGHGSHITPDFIDYCHRHRILLAIFPPHATHSLQPLDVVLYKPLSTGYSDAISDFLHRSQGLLQVQKSDFIRLFWQAYTQTFTTNNILSSFRSTGIHPPDPEVVLKRFKISTPRPGIDPELGQHGDGDTWRELSHLFDAAVSDKSTVAARRLNLALHSLQIRNELLRRENDELRDEISTKKRPKKHKKVLDLQQHQEYESTAMVWSPRSIREARARERVRQQQEESDKRKKQRDKEFKAANAILRKKLVEEAKKSREIQKVEREKERQAKAAQLAAARAQKAQERAAATTKKLQDRESKAKRKALVSQNQNPTKRRRVVGDKSGGVNTESTAKPPTKTTMRGRNIKLPKKFE